MLNKGRRYISTAFTYFLNLIFLFLLLLYLSHVLWNEVNALHNIWLHTAMRPRISKERRKKELDPLYFYLIGVLLKGLSEDATQRLAF